MADLDLITLAEAKAQINMSGTSHDTEIARYVTAVSLRIDDLCGPVVERTVEELHDGGRSFIRPNHTPIASVSSLVEWRDSSSSPLTVETLEVKPGAGYLVYDGDGHHNVTILRRSNNTDSRFASGRRNIQLTYRAGRFSDTESVDPKFKQAAALTLLHLWKPASATWAQSPDWMDAINTPTEMSPVPGWAVPRAVKELLADELLPPAVA